MTDNQDGVASLLDMLERIALINKDSSFENSVVKLLRKLDPDAGWMLVHALLTDPKANTRALGLRIVRRAFRDKVLLRQVIYLCFSVDRLAELQYWYRAILAHYPIAGFLSLLKNEMLSRGDPDFAALHIRALQFHNGAGCKRKRDGLENLNEIFLAIKQSRISDGSL